MPGIVGYTSRRYPIDTKTVGDAVDMLAHESWYHRDPEFSDGFIAAGGTHAGVPGENEYLHVSHDIMCWVEGECYNSGEAADTLNLSAASFPELLTEAYSRSNLTDFLRMVDGYFCAVLYDSKRKRIVIMSDRYGLKPLFIVNRNNLFAWSSELKGLFPLPGFEKDISGDSIRCFLDVGHFIGNLTWFENVSMMPSSTMLIYDIEAATIDKKRYWRWSDIKSAPISFDDSVHMMGPILKESVARRLRHEENTGLALSGGLDSRALLGSLDDTGNITAFTFGTKRSWDIAIARRAAEVGNIHHRIFELNGDNWFRGRIRDIWRTDGMLNMMHMHGSPFLPKLKELFSVNLNGFVGGVFGGFYFHLLGNRHVGERIGKNTAHELYGRYSEYDDADDSFYDIDSADPYILNNRARRMMACGSVTHAAYIVQRKPFIDNRIMEFIYSIPDDYRSEGKLYYSALLEAFPSLFRAIPWQGSGFPISKHTHGISMYLHKLRHIGDRLSLMRLSQKFTDYDIWLSDPDVRAAFLGLLDPAHAIYPDYIDIKRVENIIGPYRNEKDFNSDSLCRAVTAELWLRRVFGKPIPEMEAFDRD